MTLRLAGETYTSQGVFDTVTVIDGAGHYLQLPKLTTAQRDGLTPVNGMVIYNTTTGQFECREGDAWVRVAIAGHAQAGTGVHGVGSKYVAAIASQGAEALPLTGGTLSGSLLFSAGNLGGPTNPASAAYIFSHIKFTRNGITYLDALPLTGQLVIRKTDESAQLFFMNQNGKMTFLATGDCVMPNADNQGNIGNTGARWALVRAVTITSGDLGFEERICPKCNNPFVDGEKLILAVKAIHDLGTLTIPLHLGCAQAPAKTIAISVPQMKTRYRFVEGEIRPIRVPHRERVKVVRRQVKHGPGAEGFEPQPLYALDEETGTFRDQAGNAIAFDEATEVVEQEIERIIYEERAITL